MNELDTLALAALKTAAAARPTDRLAYAEVSAGDVVRIAALVAEPDEIVAALADGAANALKGWNETKRGPLKVAQDAAQVRHLIRAAEGANADEMPAPK